ncbi:uncharacterized protein LOC135842745 [Planococcus citri]|uniref:uncharacterized protein LOC135842745 n=1 Tax=Planococcus citri TaxID=170843 RepID=UPI0031F89142
MLIDIPAEEVSNFLQVLKKELPYSLFAINYIETCNKWKQKNDQLEISLLYTESSMKTGVFVGILKSGCNGISATFYAFDNYSNDLEISLQKVPIHWSNVTRFEGIVGKHTQIAEKLISDYGIEMESFLLTIVSLPKEDALKLEVTCPDRVEFAPLNDQHANEIHNLWGLKYDYSVDALKYSIRYNNEAAYGVFCKTSGELLSRCIRSHTGFLGALQTVKSAQNKGYAKLLLKYIAKRLAEKDILPCGFIEDDNFASLHVFRSLGFKDMCKMKNYTAHKNDTHSCKMIN